MKITNVILAFCLSSCVYHTENIYEEQPDASEDVMSRVTERGSAKSVVLTRGNYNPVSLGNQTWEPAFTYTVQFSTIPNGGPVPKAQGPTETFAIIKWTIAGNDIQRIVSVGNGVSVVGVGEGVTIQVYDATTLLPGPDPFPQYTVTATVSPGFRGASGNPPTYFPALADPNTGIAASGNILPATQISIPIPQNAGIISVQVLAGPQVLTFPLTVAQLRVDLTDARIYNPLEYTGFIPIDPSAFFIVIENVDVKSGFYSMCYGVDG